MNYVKTVSDLFLARCGCEILKVEDYVAIAEWEKEQIPLEIALNSINRFFDTLKTENRPLCISIKILQPDIKEQFADWLQNLSEKK